MIKIQIMRLQDLRNPNSPPNASIRHSVDNNANSLVITDISAILDISNIFGLMVVIPAKSRHQ